MKKIELTGNELHTLIGMCELRYQGKGREWVDYLLMMDEILRYEFDYVLNERYTQKLFLDVDWVLHSGWAKKLEARPIEILELAKEATHLEEKVRIVRTDPPKKK